MGGSGKTEFCKRYAQQPGLEGPVLHLDWYLKYSSLERHQRMADAVASGDPVRIEAEENPMYWQDWTATTAAIQDLRRTGRLRVEQGWDQRTGEKVFSAEARADEDAVIWCDLVALLHPELAELADLIVLLEVQGKMMHERGGARDQHRSDPAYLAYKARITEQYDAPYFEHYRDRADMIIDNSDFEDQKIVR
jgi:uridine kinase